MFEIFHFTNLNENRSKIYDSKGCYSFPSRQLVEVQNNEENKNKNKKIPPSYRHGNPISYIEIDMAQKENKQIDKPKINWYHLETNFEWK